MAAINDLIAQVENPELRARLEQEVARLNRQKKFGLVFEDHMPECTPLYDVPIRRGSHVALRTQKDIQKIYMVIDIKSDKAICYCDSDKEQSEYALSDLVAVAQFGEPIYPYLKQLDSVCNAPDSDLWHALIEADNYHALQLLCYLYAGKVDCIYIDPPYNTGAKDWKYNNDYVDGNDSYRHSKWLSMMEKRLKLAKKLLNPKDSVMIVTIDEKEYLHLGCLLEELFPDATIQTVTNVINPKGVTQGRFARVEEYIIYVFIGDAQLSPWKDSMLGNVEKSNKVRWAVLLRSGNNSQRADRKNMFYPIYIDPINKRVVSAGEALPFDQHPIIGEQENGYDVAWPIRTDGSEGNWSVGYSTLNRLISEGYVSLGGYDKKRKTWAITYLNEKIRAQIDTGDVIITDRNPVTGVVDVEYQTSKSHEVRTVWNRALHNAGTYGSDILTAIIGKSKSFSFPKSVYAVHDAIAMVTLHKPNALVVDFFAGSGTTLNAIALLNQEDGGHRRCILVTNNEVSAEEAKQLSSDGVRPGETEWIENGICHSVTWPRVKNCIAGKRLDGVDIPGEYYAMRTIDSEQSRSVYQIGFVQSSADMPVSVKKQIVAMLGKERLPQSVVKKECAYAISEKHEVAILFDPNACDEFVETLTDNPQVTDIYVVTDKKPVFDGVKQRLVEQAGKYYQEQTEKRLMSLGFETNAAFFKLGFLDKTSVALGRQFNELLPVLWMKAGAIGPCPSFEHDESIQTLIFDENRFAVLLDETSFPAFEQEINLHPQIQTIYIVTDYEVGFRAMSDVLVGKKCYQLYRDYLDNFRINQGRA